MGLPPRALSITILRALRTAPSCISNTISGGKSASSSNSLSTGDNPWGSSPDGGVDLVPLPVGAIRGGVDGADAGVVSCLLCMSFELDALALAVEWSWATYPIAITSTSPRPNPGPMLIAERSAMHVGEEVRGGT